MQDPQREEFHRARRVLLSVGRGARQVDAAEVYDWFAEWKRRGSLVTPVDDTLERHTMLPFECTRELAILVHLHDAIQLGPIDGLEKLSGRAAASWRRLGQKGGAATGAQRAEHGKETAESVIAAWKQFGERPERERAGLIAMKIGKTAQYVRKIIRKANLKRA